MCLDRIFPHHTQQYRRPKMHGDELEEMFDDKHGKPWVKVLSGRRRYVLKPANTKNITSGQFVQNYG